jgi:hypothetical protein
MVASWALTFETGRLSSSGSASHEEDRAALVSQDQRERKAVAAISSRTTAVSSKPQSIRVPDTSITRFHFADSLFRVSAA